MPLLNVIYDNLATLLYSSVSRCHMLMSDVALSYAMKMMYL
jgi:hypothetical protein